MVVINASILLFTGSFSLIPTIGEMRMSQNTMIRRQKPHNGGLMINLGIVFSVSEANRWH